MESDLRLLEAGVAERGTDNGAGRSLVFRGLLRGRFSSVDVFLPDSEEVSSSSIRVVFNGATRSGSLLAFFVEFVSIEEGGVAEDVLVASFSDKEDSDGFLPS